MKRILKSILALALCVSFAQCEDYLNVSSPSNSDDDFVTSSPAETFKTLSWIYAEYRLNAASGGNYNFEDCTSDAEYYPEYNSANNVIGMLRPNEVAIGGKQTQFNSLYNTVARAARVADIIAGKSEYQADVAAGKTSDWTQLYGEAMTMRAFFYFELVRHFGDVPYGIENAVVSDYGLTSRFEILDNMIESVKTVESLMYRLGEGGITAERMSRTFANALIGEMAIYAAGWQTVRTDVSGLYGDVQFEEKGTKANDCVYARRTDYKTYYQMAEQYLSAAINEQKGTLQLITSDDRGYANNPFQMHWQYIHNKKISPESLFEVGNVAPNGSEHPYSQGRPSNGGGSNAAPCKVFGAIRILPSFYYTGYEEGDKRMDASMTVTGSTGDGNEAILSFVAGSKLNGGISINKWDDNRMNPPYVAAQRNSGLNYCPSHLADVMLLLAEAKAELGDDNGALSLVNQLRERAFGDTSHNLSGLSGEALKDAVWMERKRELLGEGDVRWDMIRSGKFTERTQAVRAEMKAMIAGLETNGYYEFPNGRIISNYIWTKLVEREDPLTYDADPSDPALFPGWRGQYDYSKLDAVASKVKGTAHNLAIKGLFEYIDPEGPVAKALEAEGYTKTNWGIDIVSQKTTLYDRNVLSGLGDAGAAPRYYHPIPFETLNQSKGKVTNGYGLPQQ
ncbi:RagB/SusD family nutrient uptake outer membrane protein [Bacteroides sp. GD17]|jgi:hypothetical protein|uniref:RagB/SusD family nutrient uptake outer membrane protein n=1 Tax=Bacteroides sp. GD17 TaxID=3139826 RepID=UPI0025D2795E|nr:RagB/SusD family nutrient uptake outer membrane protein [uncultured Bacteroides sp.]